METKTKNDFKAVDFMRKVRNELSDLYYNYKERFHKKVKKAMDDFLSARKKPSANNANSGA